MVFIEKKKWKFEYMLMAEWFLVLIVLFCSIFCTINLGFQVRIILAIKSTRLLCKLVVEFGNWEMGQKDR